MNKGSIMRQLKVRLVYYTMTCARVTITHLGSLPPSLYFYHYDLSALERPMLP